MKYVNQLRKTGLLLGALIILSVAIFAFTQPMLAPGFDIRNFSSSSTEPSIDNNVFSLNSPHENDLQQIQATSFLVFEELSGKVLASKNPQTPVAIASITKLMTAYVVQKHGDLEAIWAIDSLSTHDIRPILGLNEGDRVKIKDLVNAILIGSTNDAASALGQYITTTQNIPIAELMNREAKNLGMESTHYENPIGFDSEQNYSTAADLQLLLLTIRPLPLFSSIDRKQSYSFTSEGGTLYSAKATNTLLSQDPEIHAIKTGYTDEAGGAMITAIYHGDIKFIIIVLGSPNREQDTLLLKEAMIKSLTK